MERKWGTRSGAAGVRDVCGPESDMPCPPCVCFVTSKAKLKENPIPPYNKVVCFVVFCVHSSVGLFLFFVFVVCPLPSPSLGAPAFSFRSFKSLPKNLSLTCNEVTSNVAARPRGLEGCMNMCACACACVHVHEPITRCRSRQTAHCFIPARVSEVGEREGGGEGVHRAPFEFCARTALQIGLLYAMSALLFVGHNGQRDGPERGLLLASLARVH